jgi:hypothetical protein
MKKLPPESLTNPESLSEAQLELLNRIKATREKGMRISQVYKALKELNMKTESFMILTERDIIKTTTSGAFIYPESTK